MTWLNLKKLESKSDTSVEIVSSVSEFLDPDDESVERCTICYHRAAAIGFDVCERCMELNDVDFL